MHHYPKTMLVNDDSFGKSAIVKTIDRVCNHNIISSWLVNPSMVTYKKWALRDVTYHIFGLEVSSMPGTDVTAPSAVARLIYRFQTVSVSLARWR